MASMARPGLQGVRGRLCCQNLLPFTQNWITKANTDKEGIAFYLTMGNTCKAAIRDQTQQKLQLEGSLDTEFSLLQTTLRLYVGM